MEGRGDRLPWLTDEPLARSAETARVPSAGRAMWPWYLLLLLLVALVTVVAFWLGTRQHNAAPPELPAEEAVPIPLNPPQAAEPDQTAGEQNVVEPGNEAVANASTAAPEQGIRRTTNRSFVPPARRVRVLPNPSASVRTGSGRSVFPADDSLAEAPPETGPSPVAVYRPNSNAGRVIQLGAFPTRAQADLTWQRVTRRYPYLATKPKMVNTVDVRALGGGRPTRMYRLQLGTSSQAQSVVICQQLERAGQSCVVVY
jgi:hypothetical protein